MSLSIAVSNLGRVTQHISAQAGNISVDRLGIEDQAEVLSFLAERPPAHGSSDWLHSRQWLG